ncbi:uncharacterized protein PpBr36_06785, partial [Pyricularia pennisetigena]|uniref:uncharacterized protein n=1 Tax=Pyricularia pennisetigena TaxID=1578925 RepID=UPI00114FBCE0
LLLQGGADKPCEIDSLRTQIHLKVRAKLQGDTQENTHLESTTRSLDLQLDDWIQIYFQKIKLIQTSSSVSQQLDKAVKARNDAGFDFKKLHLIHLLQDAIQHFTINQDLNYNFCYASRRHNPVPITIKEHISKFLVTSQALKDTQPNVYLDQALIIARRLLEMHNTPSARTHIKLLQRFKAVWQAFYHSSSCYVCFSQTADRGLTCGHRLCNPCVILSGSAGSSNPCGYHVKECPLCKEPNKNLTPIRPPTAGNRVLKLSGRRKPGLIKFFEDMRQRTAYMAYHFKPHEFFDIVIGIDTVSCPIYACNGNIDKVLPYLSTKKSSSDLIVEYDESTSPHFLQPTASRMLACLFYVELASSPDLCPDSISVHLRIRCRVPPGPSLIALLRLPLQNAQLHYWAETKETLTSLYNKNGEQCKEPLAVSKSVTQYQEGFMKNVTIKVESLASVLYIGISTATGLEMISRCPYSLEKLMQDQGFYSVFGRKDHAIYSF